MVCSLPFSWWLAIRNYLFNNNTTSGGSRIVIGCENTTSGGSSIIYSIIIPENIMRIGALLMNFLVYFDNIFLFSGSCGEVFE